jgi:hypothetical protein
MRDRYAVAMIKLHICTIIISSRQPL